MKLFGRLLLALCPAVALIACSPPRASDQTSAFKRLAGHEIKALIGPDFRAVREITVSPSKTVACGTVDTRSFGNVFALVLDKPFPTHTQVVVKIPPNAPSDGRPEARRRWGEATLKSMREITALCQDAGAELPFHRSGASAGAS